MKRVYKLNLNKFVVFLGKGLYVLAVFALGVYVAIEMLLGLAGM